MMKPKPDLAGVTLLRLARWGWLLAVLFLVGCATDRTPTRIEATPQPTLTETATIRPTTAVPSRTPTQTLPPTVTPTLTPTSIPPTWTPLPTLTLRQSLRRVAALEETNGGCRFPCWWGITPGVTSVEEARQFLSSFTRVEAEDLARNSVYWGLGVEYPPYSDRLPRLTELGTSEEKIWAIALNPYTSAKQYTLSRLLTAYGEPDLALISTYPSVPYPGNPPFTLILFFRKYCTLADFNLEGLIHADHFVRAYPQGERPRIHLWAQDYCATVDAEKIHRLFKGTLPVLPFVPLDQATALSIEEFTRLYADPSYAVPLESPFEVWENLHIISLTPTP